MLPQLDCLMHYVDKKTFGFHQRNPAVKKFFTHNRHPSNQPKSIFKRIKKIAAKDFNQFITGEIYKNLQESQSSKLLIYKNNKT